MRFYFVSLLTVFCSFSLFAQNHTDIGQIHGNIETITQYYIEDTAIGAVQPGEQILSNNFANINYTKGNFSAGIRYEYYMNTLLGFDPGYNGGGIPYKYAQFRNEDIDVTVGSFYEQFGNGLIFRSFEARQLGIDNAMNGMRVKYTALKGIVLTGLIGKQRLYFDQGAGIVRGLDADVNVNDVIPRLDTIKTRITVGASVVSKYQEDKNSQLNLPENVPAFAGRLNLTHGRFNFMGEYAYKMNDPSFDNGYIYKHGEALFLSGSYSKKGFGITLSAKSLNNMAFRSDRNEQGINTLTINYLPALTKQHTYNLVATTYPYATQPIGEVAFQGDLLYKIPKKTKLGGKYGTTIAINYSTAYSADTTQLYNYSQSLEMDSRDTLRQGFTANLFGMSDRKYFEDFNIELTRKINKKFKLKLAYIWLYYNSPIVNPGNPIKLNQYYAGIVKSHIGVGEFSYRIAKKHSIRTEVQHLYTEQDFGSWATLLVEYTFAPHWFFAIMDQYNYGNSEEKFQFHYPIGSFGYNEGGTRIMVTYGRQKAGIFCVGGVCRNVPASNGLTLSITSSF